MPALNKITCVEDFRRVARRRVPRMFYDYMDSGSWTESTYRANESDLQALKFRQRARGRLRKAGVMGFSPSGNFDQNGLCRQKGKALVMDTAGRSDDSHYL